jgi:glutamyl-tRNA synthetase
MIATLRERAKTLTELVEAAHYYLSDEITFDPTAAKKFLTKDAAVALRILSDKLSSLGAFDETTIEQAFANVLAETGLQMGALAQPARVALTGGTVSPGIHDVIAALGRKRALQRLRRALEYIDQLDSTG